MRRDEMILIAIPLAVLLGGPQSIRAIPEPASAPEIPQSERAPQATPQPRAKSLVVVITVVRPSVPPRIDPDPSYLGIVGVDTDGQPLDGARRYLLHFAKEELPPDRTRWSLTALETDPFRAGLQGGDGTLGQGGNLHYNADHSLDVYLSMNRQGQAGKRTGFALRRERSTSSRT
jgi:hypothetical protein